MTLAERLLGHSAKVPRFLHFLSLAILWLFLGLEWIYKALDQVPPQGLSKNLILFWLFALPIVITVISEFLCRATGWRIIIYGSFLLLIQITLIILSIRATTSSAILAQAVCSVIVMFGMWTLAIVVLKNGSIIDAAILNGIKRHMG